MPDHPIHRARFALEQQTKRLAGWKAKDDRQGGRQAGLIDERSDELIDLFDLVDYSLKLEHLVMRMEVAMKENWAAGYAAKTLQAFPGEKELLEISLKLVREKIETQKNKAA